MDQQMARANADLLACRRFVRETDRGIAEPAGEATQRHVTRNVFPLWSTPDPRMSCPIVSTVTSEEDLAECTRIFWVSIR
jgi:hypothetical protein